MFQGFTDETFEFFLGIKLNNNREWFEAHRGEYERFVRAPMLALIESVNPALQEMDPELDTRPNRVLSRIHRDTRFSKDKTPYRDYLWFVYRHAEEGLAETCGVYFDLSATHAHWGCGFYHVRRNVMDRLRALCVHTPSRVLEAVGSPDFQARYTLEGEDYKRMSIPEAVPEALRPLYTKKGLYAEHALSDWSLLYKPELAQVLAEDFRLLTPLYRLLRECCASA